MRFFALVFATFFFAVTLHAQTNAAPANALLAFLTPAQQEQYAKAREKALADNPDLAAEGKAIAEQGLAADHNHDATELAAFRERMTSHRQKLRAAMLKEDPSLGPIFAEIDEHISEARAKQLGQVQNSANPSTAPATH